MKRVPLQKIHTKDLHLQQVQDATADAISRIAREIPASGASIPIGARVYWDTTTITGVPALPDGWAVCNGTRLIDSKSVLNGKTLPTEVGKIIRVR